MKWEEEKGEESEEWRRRCERKRGSMD